MQLTPREKDKLLIVVAAEVARRRLNRGLRLNHPEAVALITEFLLDSHAFSYNVRGLVGARFGRG